MTLFNWPKLLLEQDHKPEIHVECEKEAKKKEVKSKLHMDKKPVPVVAEPSGFGTNSGANEEITGPSDFSSPGNVIFLCYLLQ